MELQDEVESIQRALTNLKDRLDAFEAKSKATIREDHDRMLTQLQKSVDSVHGTVAYLETGTSCLAGFLEYNTTDSAAAATSKAIVLKHLTDMDTNFTALYESTSSGLERVEHIRETGDDMYAELCSIRTQLESLNSRTASAFVTARVTLREKKSQMGEANKSLESIQAELRTLENKMEAKKDDRNLMRAARVATWGIGLFFPPVLVAAGGMEVAAYAMRKDRERLTDEIDSASTKKWSLQSEISTLEKQEATLDKAVKTARDLWNRSRAINWSVEEVKGLVEERLDEYQTLKDNTDKFRAWTRELSDQTATMSYFDPSQARLRNTTKKIVDSLLDNDHKGVQAICGQLKRLDITPGAVPTARE